MARAKTRRVGEYSYNNQTHLVSPVGPPRGGFRLWRPARCGVVVEELRGSQAVDRLESLDRVGSFESHAREHRVPEEVPHIRGWESDRDECDKGSGPAGRPARHACALSVTSRSWQCRQSLPFRISAASGRMSEFFKMTYSRVFLLFLGVGVGLALAETHRAPVGLYASRAVVGARREAARGVPPGTSSRTRR